MKDKMLKPGILAEIVTVFAVGAAAYPYVREMLAALLLFSMLFAVLAVVVLFLFLLDQGFYRLLTWTEPRAVHAGQRLCLALVEVEHFGRKQLHRSEEPLER